MFYNITYIKVLKKDRSYRILWKYWLRNNGISFLGKKQFRIEKKRIMFEKKLPLKNEMFKKRSISFFLFEFFEL